MDSLFFCVENSKFKIQNSKSNRFLKPRMFSFKNLLDFIEFKMLCLFKRLHIYQFSVNTVLAQ